MFSNKGYQFENEPTGINVYGHTTHQVGDLYEKGSFLIELTTAAQDDIGVSWKKLLEKRRAALQGYYQPSLPATELRKWDVQGLYWLEEIPCMDAESRLPKRTQAWSAFLSDVGADSPGQPRQEVGGASLGLPARREVFSREQLQSDETAQLRAKVRFLEEQLRANLPYLRLYKFGGASLLVAILSLMAWIITGVGVPFHPVFAAMVVPVSIGVMVMAFFLRREVRG